MHVSPRRILPQLLKVGKPMEQARARQGLWFMCPHSVLYTVLVKARPRKCQTVLKESENGFVWMEQRR